jgi:hypothetical protein
MEAIGSCLAILAIMDMLEGFCLKFPKEGGSESLEGQSKA